jgi:E3 ubiquitin-protein ligase UBR7
MPYLLHEEEIFEPPEDNDAHKSLFDLGTEALLQMPREQAVQGLEAYASMRDGLRAYLEPFAREGKIVQESDIQDFFRAEKEKMAALARGQQLS